MPSYRSLGRKLSRAERYQKADEVLGQFGLTRLRKNNAARLSGGERRRLEIARCLVCEPLLILLDEPFTGIDPITIADIRQIVRDLSRQGIGILVTDHNVRETLKITDRSYLIKDGLVRTHGTPQQIINDPIAIREYLGAGFNEDGFVTTPSHSAPSEKTPEVSVHRIVEQERIRRLIEALKTGDHASAAAHLVQAGRAVAPALLEPLEPPDVELRRQAFAVFHRLPARTALFAPSPPPPPP